MKRYIFLVRHGEKDKKPSVCIHDKDRDLSCKGRNDVMRIAAQFRETLAQSQYCIPIKAIWCGSYKHTKETAKIYRDALSSIDKTAQFEPQGILDPSRRDEYVCVVCKSLGNLKCGEGILVVGHQPQLGQMARWLTAELVPIASSELVCIEVEQKEKRAENGKKKEEEALKRGVGRLLWTISDEDDKTEEELHAKIRSKMETAKLFGAFIVAALSLILGFLLDSSKSMGLGLYQKIVLCISGASFLSAIVLYWITMLAYDQLLMPTRFWGEEEPQSGQEWQLKRPPTSSHRVLYRAMKRIWNRRFKPATYCVLAGLICLSCAVIMPITGFSECNTALTMIPLVLLPIGLLSLAVCLLHQGFQPGLGIED